jgi:hypothetical protein
MKRSTIRFSATRIELDSHLRQIRSQRIHCPKFDLLLNYYDTEKPALLLVSNQSKAAFKVGFASIDKKLNHFMINTNAENYKVFVEELFKYLKILNKI